jgi:hypothetical protein
VREPGCSPIEEPSFIRASSYSITVLNWNDNDSGKFNPHPVKANINFRGKQAVYEFPVGVTTLTWYAAPK